MAAHSFGGRDVPYEVRGAQLLLYFECALLVLLGLFAAAIGILLGSGNSIPFAGAEVSGAAAAVLGAVFGLLGLGALYLAVEVGRLVAWTRVAAIVLQAILIVLFLARGNLSPSTVVSLAICLAVAGFLLTPSAAAAFSPPPSSSGGGGR